MSPDKGKLGRRLAGVAFLLVMALLVTLSIMIYTQTFTSAVQVTLFTDRTGNQLNQNADVKARGVLVGHVRQIRHTATGAEVTLALEPDRISRIHRDVSALLVPKTLFGERYVQLSLPERSTESPIKDGDRIEQDRSANAIELERVFDDLLPVLQAVQPQKIATTLTAISTALDGRGAELGKALVTVSDYLAQLNPNLPTLDEDLTNLATVATNYGDLAPDLLDALTDSAVTLNTVADQQGNLEGLYARLTATSQDVTQFLRSNQDNIIRLSASSRAPLELLARYSPSFPCTFKALTDLIPSMNKVLGAGTAEPGLHVQVLVTQPRGKYVPGVDDPRYTVTGGPKCYPSGVAPGAGITPAIAPTEILTPAVSGGSGDLGLPNSPQEQQLLAALLGPQLGVAPADVAPWSGVLVGPLYRGTEVALR
jgi:phospholipid/cholesterol/gamma-HCH transport system substrate-binding protein